MNSKIRQYSDINKGTDNNSSYLFYPINFLQTKPEEIIRGEDNKTCFDGLLWAKLIYQNLFVVFSFDKN